MIFHRVALFIKSSTKGHPSCSSFPIVNRAAINTMYCLLYKHNFSPFLDKYTQMQTLDYMVIMCLVLLGTSQTMFQSGCTILHSHKWPRSLSCSTSSPALDDATACILSWYTTFAKMGQSYFNLNMYCATQECLPKQSRQKVIEYKLQKCECRFKS